MSRTVLLTLGRLPKGLDLARSFHQAGYRVIVAEPFRWHLMRVSNAVARSYQVTAPAIDRKRYLDDLERIIGDERVELVVPISEETMHVAALKERLSDHVKMFTMEQNALLKLHDKKHFIEFAHRIGLAAPETYRLSDPRAKAFAETYDHVVKPVFSCAGRGVRIAKAGTSLPADDPASPSIVQAYVEGPVVSSFSIVHQGHVLLTVLYHGVIMTGTVAIGFERVDGQTAMHDWIAHFAEQADYSGFIAFDFVVDPDGQPLGIECNPRVTSGIHFVATDNLAPILLYPYRATPPRLVVDSLLQQFWPCLTETQTSLLEPRRFLRYLHHLVKARDVTWKLSDPLPFLLMPLTSLRIISQALFTKQTLGEAATADIEWHGGEAPLSVKDDAPLIRKTDAAPGT